MCANEVGVTAMLRVGEVLFDEAAIRGLRRQFQVAAQCIGCRAGLAGFAQGQAMLAPGLRRARPAAGRLGIQGGGDRVIIVLAAATVRFTQEEGVQPGILRRGRCAQVTDDLDRTCVHAPGQFVLEPVPQDCGRTASWMSSRPTDAPDAGHRRRGAQVVATFTGLRMGREDRNRLAVVARVFFAQHAFPEFDAGVGVVTLRIQLCEPDPVGFALLVAAELHHLGQPGQVGGHARDSDAGAGGQHAEACSGTPNSA